MTSQAHFVHPPRIALWLISLFTSTEEAESILGDLLEEYSDLASKSGDRFARSWFWRQAVKTIVHLVGTGFRVSPWSTTATIVGGFLLLRFVMGLNDKLLMVVTDRYLAFWSGHFNAYIWFLYGMLIPHLIALMFVGCVVALAAKGKEMVAATMLSLFLGALLIVAVAMAATTDRDWFLLLSRLPWHIADSFAIVIGGAIVRTRRSAATPLPSNC
jgi:CDP-diglyceride synthetase